MSDLEQSAEQQNSDASLQQDGSQQADQVEHNEDDAGQAEGDSQEQLTEEETSEIDVDGSKYELPKSAAEKLQAERMMHADYTRKTQEAARDREVAAAERQQHQQRVTDYEQEFADRAKLHNISDSLQQYANVDWQAAWEQDPIAAGKAQAQIQQLQAARTQLESNIAQKQQQRALDEQQSTAKLVEEAEAYVQREIPGWTVERGEQLKNFAANEGLKLDQEMARMLFKQPALLKVLHKAALFDQLEKVQQKPQSKPAIVAKPVPKVGANSTVQKDPSAMTDKEYAAWRRKQINNRT